MQINSIQSSYNINHKGFVNDYKVLKRQVQVSRIKNEFSPSPNHFDLLRNAEKSLQDFCKKNPIKSFFYSLIKNFKIFPQKTIRPLNKISPIDIQLTEKKLENKKEHLKYIIDGKEYSVSEFNNLYINEANPIKKEELLKQHTSLLASLEDDLRDLVRKRNDYARNLGYKNFFEYVLNTQYNMSSKELDKLINEYINKEEVKNCVSKRREILEKEHGIEFSKMLTSQIHPITEFCNINGYIKSPETVVEIVKKTYEKMGFDIKSYEKDGRIYYDLFPAKNKSLHVFCSNFVDTDATMIFANLKADTNSIRALSHEMGHAMYDLNVSKYLPYSKKYPKAFYTEAIATMFEKILLEKELLKELVPINVLDKYQEYLKIEKFYAGLVMIAEAEFEKEMYNNPNQDFTTLRKRISKKYNLNPKNEIWFVDHYISYPIRRPVYLKGLILADKIYNSLRNKLGSEISSSPKTAEILINKIFKYGGFMNDSLLHYNLKN